MLIARCVLSVSLVIIVFFFFQAEDGIRDWSVTGVQTCALPIFPAAFEEVRVTRRIHRKPLEPISLSLLRGITGLVGILVVALALISILLLWHRTRSEERRVGKECRSWWWSYHEK